MLVGKLKGKRPLGKPKHIWDDEISAGPGNSPTVVCCEHVNELLSIKGGEYRDQLIECKLLKKDYDPFI
jgi:hypothetical protein